MARVILSALAFASVLLVLAGCGGDAAADCGDEAFVAQRAQLRVAQGSIANAIAGQAPQEALAADLRQGADVLATLLDEARPCDPDLVDLRETELASLARMYEAADAYERGDDPPRDELTRASADLTAVEERLVARKG
jgi:hypothetical protein